MLRVPSRRDDAPRLRRLQRQDDQSIRAITGGAGRSETDAGGTGPCAGASGSALGQRSALRNGGRDAAARSSAASRPQRRRPQMSSGDEPTRYGGPPRDAHLIIARPFTAWPIKPSSFSISDRSSPSSSRVACANCRSTRRFFRSTRRSLRFARRNAGRRSSCPAGRRAYRRTGAPHCDPGVFAAGVPVLGICYGMQLMTDALGGEVAPAPHREFGLATIRIAPDAPLFGSMPDELRVWASHGDFVGRRRRGIRGDRDQRERPGRGDGRAGSQTVRAPVPSRGCTHRSRPRHPPQFRLRHLRLHRRLDDGVVREGGDRRRSASRWATGGSCAA